ncbi:polygalacturonase [Quercus suber]|uniref:Polygalacturonase n=1 Tax=Quercus suber TaxID=58331 RepID=A0AAW0J4Z0_QUESU
MKKRKRKAQEKKSSKEKFYWHVIKYMKNSGVKISQVTYKNIRGTSASKVAMNFICSSSNPCNGIKLQNIRLTYNKRAATSSCSNAAGFSNEVVIPRSCLQK